MSDNKKTITVLREYYRGGLLTKVSGIIKIDHLGQCEFRMRRRTRTRIFRLFVSFSSVHPWNEYLWPDFSEVHYQNREMIRWLCDNSEDLIFCSKKARS